MDPQLIEVLTEISQSLKAIRLLLEQQTGKVRRTVERQSLVQHGPYTEEELKRFKRPQLVMYAAALGIKDTAVGQSQLIHRVLYKQDLAKHPELVSWVNEPKPGMPG